MEGYGLSCFYGIENSKESYQLKSFFFDEMIQGINEDWQPAIQAVTPILQCAEVYLFVSITAVTAWDRMKPFSEVVSHRFKIFGETVAENSTIVSRHEVFRVGVIKATNCSIESVLKVLYENSSSSFITVMQSSCGESGWIHDLLANWHDQSLNSKFIAGCVNTVCQHDGLFLHLLVGCDGFSINCITQNSELLEIH